MHDALFHIGPVPISNLTMTSWVIILLLTAFFYFGTRNMKKIPSGIQNVAEMAVEALLNFFSGVIGEKRARMYTPLLATFFIFILICNYSGLIPGAGTVKGFAPPTSNWNVTAALAIVVFLATHFLGVKAKGGSYFKHFLTPFAVMLPLNILEEAVRPVSLTLRLFGNIFAEESIIAVLLGLVPFMLPVAMMGLSVLLGAIQAFVFTILATTFIGTATEEHH